MLAIPKFKFLDVPIAAVSASTAAEAVITAAVEHDPVAFRLVNAGTFYAASVSLEYQDLLKGGGVNFPDGKPLAAIIRRDRRAAEQVRGPKLFEQCLKQGLQSDIQHYFLGSSEETLAKLVRALEIRYHGIRIAGVNSPPFRALAAHERSAQDRSIIASGADIVWVALGTPKQDLEASRITGSTGITTVAVGAAFDFSAGTKREAPRYVRHLGLEWMFRLLCEPRRLGRRYLLGNAHFMRMAVRHLLKR